MVAIGRLALLACLGAGCAPGDGGAVVVRWKLIDAAAGQLATGCAIQDDSEANCSKWIDVVVDHVRLRIENLVDGHEPPCATCVRACDSLEATTEFEIPEGRYRFSLEALSCGVRVGNSPPPIERTVFVGQITNLDVIGISIPPGTITPQACAAAGPPCGDMLSPAPVAADLSD